MHEDVRLRLDKVTEHFKESLSREREVIGTFLQGSQNYNLDTEQSDFDTKTLIAPTFEDVAMHRQPKSYTHVRDNGEHIDFKDVRLYLPLFRKQNINFLEILFTNTYSYTLPYKEQIARLRELDTREKIARVNPYRAAYAMAGTVNEKYKAFNNAKEQPSLQLNKYLYNLVRVHKTMWKYFHDYSYLDSIRFDHDDRNFLLDIKRGNYPLSEMVKIANTYKAENDVLLDTVLKKYKDKEDTETVKLLEDVQKEIVRISMQRTM